MNQKQFEFTRAIGQLIEYAYSQGYKLTFGDAYRDPRVFGRPGDKMGYSHPWSTHKWRLAVDFNLFIKGKYISGWNNAWKDLHDYWLKLGGAEMIHGDYNHFSFEHRGIQ